MNGFHKNIFTKEIAVQGNAKIRTKLCSVPRYSDFGHSGVRFVRTSKIRTFSAKLYHFIYNQKKLLKQSRLVQLPKSEQFCLDFGRFQNPNDFAAERLSTVRNPN